MLLAGDIGGTNTRLGFFEREAGRPRRIAVGVFPTLDYSDVVDIVATFARDIVANGLKLEAACFGVAGPVVGQSAELTNVPWRIDAERISRALDVARVRLLNDLEAMAHAGPVLKAEELQVLQAGHPTSDGNKAVIAPGQ